MLRLHLGITDRTEWWTIPVHAAIFHWAIDVFIIRTTTLEKPYVLTATPATGFRPLIMYRTPCRIGWFDTSWNRR